MTGRIPLWVDLAQVPATERDAIQAAAIKAGADRILDETATDVQRIRLRDASDQTSAADADGVVLVDCDDWTVIPLENLIAARRDRPGTLFAVARSVEEALRFRHVLDVGVHGIALVPPTAEDIGRAMQALQDAGPRSDDQEGTEATGPKIRLDGAVITQVHDAGNAERVCVDCTERFHDGEGLLVGSTSSSFILVHAETVQTDFVNARPFRVNAGAVHSYLMAPDDHTQYLSEVQAGTPVLAVAADGSTRHLTVGRSKIEHRPHALVAWRSEDGSEGSAVVQYAETIRFIRPDGSLVAVTDLQEGDAVLVHDSPSARHMGMPVQERLREQ